jgi:hypothetical protein
MYGVSVVRPDAGFFGTPRIDTSRSSIIVPNKPPVNAVFIFLKMETFEILSDDKGVVVIINEVIVSERKPGTITTLVNSPSRGCITRKPVSMESLIIVKLGVADMHLQSGIGMFFIGFQTDSPSLRFCCNVMGCIASVVAYKETTINAEEALFGNVKVRINSASFADIIIDWSSVPYPGTVVCELTPDEVSTCVAKKDSASVSMSL